jgi:cytochrome P450
MKLDIRTSTLLQRSLTLILAALKRWSQVIPGCVQRNPQGRSLIITKGIRRPPLTFDAPAHTPYRVALDRTLKAARLKRLEIALEGHAENEMAKIVKNGKGNICVDFAAIYSAWVETEWLNLDKDIAPQLATNAREWVAAWRRQDWVNVKKYSDGFYDIARAVLEDRRKNPRYQL